MAEPIYDETVERFYDRLPGLYKFEDTQNDWTMKKFIASICEQLHVVDHLSDRFIYAPPEDHPVEEQKHSDLVDPMYADAAWLPWLAQMVGIHFTTVLTDAQKRGMIANALGGVQAGTTASIIQAAQTVLTGTKTVYVYPASNLTGIGAGTQWEVLVVTLPEETTTDPTLAVIAAGAKPAGVKLYHQTYGASWNTIEASLPTWNDWETRTWDEIERTT